MVKAADHAYALIRAEIMSGALRPGEPLPEEQLAALCGVSRTPVREAIQRLQADGLAQANSGRRSFVADWPLAAVLDAFELRGLLESRAAARAADRIGADGLDTLAAANADLAEAIDQPQPDITRFLAANRRFHAAITDAAASEPLRRALLGTVEQPVMLRTARQYRRDELLQSHREHAALIDAFAARDPDRASRHMAAHLARAAHAYAAAFARARETEAA